MIDATLIQRCAQALLESSPAGSDVILFGSRARGDQRHDSDADFLVIQPQVRSRVAEAARLARVLRPFRVPADILVVSRDTFEEWKDIPNSVYFEAARHGQVLA
jgi:predicted nucleotidyltransferase